MKRTAVIICALPLMFMALGCSGKLSRREAKHQIDAMMKPHPVGPQKVMVPGAAPGFGLADADNEGLPSSFQLDSHKEYGNLVSEQAQKPPSDEDYLLDALSKMGYVTVQEEGPKDIVFAGTALHYSHSRTVRLTQKVGNVAKTGYSEDYSSGFSCYPSPDFAQCNLPPLLETGKDYTITGIVQDETHAKVNILIPWKLTKFGLELQPYAASVRANEDKLKESDYYLYSVLYPWEHFLNSHASSGGSPATVLFQKFDDGWRIVDENGKSEKDWN